MPGHCPEPGGAGGLCYIRRIFSGPLVKPRLLALQIKRIGDLILTAPALARLRQARPEAAITLVTMGPAGQLAPALPSVDEHFNYRRGRPNLALWSDLATGGYEAVLDFNGLDRSVLMTWLTQAEIRATYEKRRQGYWRERIYTHASRARLRDLHTVEHMLALLDTLDLPAPPRHEPAPPSLVIPAAVGERMERRLAELGLDRPFAVVHPGTARPEKYWLAGRWAAVIDALASADGGLPCVITGGSDAAESRHLAEILAACRGPRPVVLAGSLSLLETAAVIARCSLALGVDTAAMHLAAAFQRPQVALFGPTNPYQWRPWSPVARVVLAGQTRPMTEADWLPQMPEVAMEAITVEQVIEAVGDRLRASGSGLGAP